MNKDTAQSDPAEGSREVIERQLERQEKGEAESKTPVTRRGEEREVEAERGEPQ
jgi:hypothetical protein